ncbi:hypothetical protein ACFVH6_01125 [Spirillospora sp. NPDC127200]
MSAGRLLARMTVAPALLIVAWLAVALPLLLAGAFGPGPAFALFVPVAGVLLWLGLRDRPRGADPDDRTLPGPLGAVSWWSTGGVLAVALVFLAVQLVMCSEQIIVRRDPASYVQFATWLNDHGSLPVPQWRVAFGGGDPVLGYGSPAFYQQGADVVPQFMAGLPMILALGGWIGGTHALLAMAPVLGACAVLTFGGLVARLVGPRWAPLGALLLALTTPMIWVSRATLSELPALVMLLGGLALLHDVRKEEIRSARAKAFLAGLALGLIVLVRIDGLRDVLPVVAFAGLLVARRRRTGMPLAAGLAIGVGAGLLEGFVLSRPYLRYLHASLDPLLLLTTLLVAATGAGVMLYRWAPVRERLRRLGGAVARGPLPDVAAALTLLALAAFAARPFVQTVRRVPTNPDDRLNSQFIAEIQRINHLAVDGTRQYTELSLYWVIWYVGVPVLLMAAFGAALLVRRLLRGRSPEWLLPYMVIVWTTATTLVRPGITPDHPWAGRRLITVVVPGLILLAVWATAWTLRRVRRLGYGPRVVRPGAVFAALLLVVPVALSSAGVLVSRTHRGEVAAVQGLCRAMGPGRSVVIVDRATADMFLQVVRSMCGLPAARTAQGATPEDVWRVTGKIYAAGRRPVLLGADPRQLTAYGAPVHALALRTRQDERTLTEPPDGTWTLNLNVWLTEPPRR